MPPETPSATYKFDVVNQVEAALAGDPALAARFDWLLKVWNTDDDRCYEEFDPTRPYGAAYVPADDPDDGEDPMPFPRDDDDDDDDLSDLDIDFGDDDDDDESPP